MAKNFQVGYGSLIIWPPGFGSIIQDYGGISGSERNIYGSTALLRGIENTVQ
jgi:hypothetical protein